MLQESDPPHHDPNPGRKTLVLGTAISSTVQQAAGRLSRTAGSDNVVVGVAEVETWKFAHEAFEIVVFGEELIPFDRVETRDIVAAEQFREVVFPFGLPRQSLFGAVRLVRALPEQRFVVETSWARLEKRAFVILALSLLTLLGWIPLNLLQRLTFAVDGVGVILGGVLARIRPHPPTDGTRHGVCHVLPSLGTGGAQRQVVEYFRHGNPVQRARLLTLFDSSDRFLKELESDGTPPDILARRCRSNPIGRVAIRFFPNTTAMTALYWRLRSLRPASVVSWLFQANVVAASAARLAGVPMVLSSIRNMSSWKSWPEFRKWWYWPADRLTTPLCDVVFANSRAAADDFMRWTKIRGLEVAVVWNGLDIDGLLSARRADIRLRHGLATEVPLLLTVGRLSSEKDHAVLMRACTRNDLAAMDWHLLVVGHGVLEPELRRLVDDLGLASRITFCGRQDDPQSYYAGSDLFILTSRIEGLPNALIEAQAMGLAAVTTDCGGAAEIVEDGVTGHVVAIGDEEALADTIGKLLTAEDTRAEMGRAAADRCRRDFGVDRMVSAIDRLEGGAENG